MAKLRCTKCPNTKVFENLVYVKGKYTAKCGKCGTVVTGKGGLEIGEIRGGITFNFSE